MHGNGVQPPPPGFWNPYAPIPAMPLAALPHVMPLGALPPPLTPPPTPPQKQTHRGRRKGGGSGAGGGSQSDGGYRSAGSTSASDGAGGRRRKAGGGGAGGAGASGGILQDMGNLGGDAFLEETLQEVNARLAEVGITVRLPTVSEREPADSLRLITTVGPLLESCAKEHAPGLLQCLGIALSWQKEALTTEVVTQVLDALRAHCRSDAEDTRYHTLAALNSLFKNCFPKKKNAVQELVLALLPGTDGDASEGPLGAMLLRDSSHRVRTLAAGVVTHLVEQTAHLMAQAEPTRPSNRSFLSFSERLGCILHQVHALCIAALRGMETPAYAPLAAAVLHLLQSTVAITSYHKLPATADLLGAFVPALFEMSVGTEKGVIIAAMQVLCSAVGTKRPYAQMGAALLVVDTYLELVIETARTRCFVAYKHEVVRLWSAIARSYPAVVEPRLHQLLLLAQELKDAPDQMSKLTAILFVSAASDQGMPCLLQPNEEIPVIDFACFGDSHLPPGADPAEVNLAGDLRRKPTGAEGAAHACVFSSQPGLFFEVLTMMVLPLTSDPVAAVRGHAILTMGNIPPLTLDSLAPEIFTSLLDTLLLLCGDENATVKGAAAKVLGVWVASSAVLAHRGRIVAALIDMFRFEQQALHQKAAWALSSLCEQLRAAPQEAADTGILQSIVQCCMEVLEQRKGKVPWNVVRALGNSGYLYAGPLDSVLKALARLFDDANVKVRWNTAYAIAQIFRNPHLRGQAAEGQGAEPVGAVALVTRLCSVLRQEVNFKVRIQACWALSALKDFPVPHATLPVALEAVVDALKTCGSHVDFEQYKYRDVLTVSLKGLLLHVLRFCLEERTDAGMYGHTGLFSVATRPPRTPPFDPSAHRHPGGAVRIQRLCLRCAGVHAALRRAHQPPVTHRRHGFLPNRRGGRRRAADPSTQQADDALPRHVWRHTHVLRASHAFVPCVHMHPFPTSHTYPGAGFP